MLLKTWKKNFFYLFIKKPLKSNDSKSGENSLKKIRWKFRPSSWLIGQIFIIYFLIVFIGAFLLCLPGVVHKTGTITNNGVVHTFKYTWNFLLALFTASSGFSDTGLSIINASNDYTIWGQIIIALLIELGGFGVLTFKVLIWVSLGRRLKIKDLILVNDERGGSDQANTIKLIKGGLLFLLFVQIIATIALFLVFYFSKVSADNQKLITGYPYHRFSLAIWYSIFHSISAINNAGFNIIGKYSLQGYSHNYLLQWIFLIEFVLGGIGFITFYDIRKKKFGFNKNHKLTLFTKLNLITYVSLSFVGVSLVCAIEYGSGNSTILHNAGGGWNGFMALFFNTMSTRNAGFSTVNTAGFLNGSKLVHIIMMFIGSAPSSTAGGIRTTTFAILILSTLYVIRNRKNFNVMKRTIPNKTVKQAGSVFFVSIILVLLNTGLICATNSNLSVIDVLYTVSSAFGTVGFSNLSTWTMYHLGWYNILFLISTMFIGQLGVSGTLLSWTSKKVKTEYSYPLEDVKIG